MRRECRHVLRHGENTPDLLTGLLRQSVYGRFAAQASPTCPVPPSR
jgi:hypothetical protein